MEVFGAAPRLARNVCPPRCPDPGSPPRPRAVNCGGRHRGRGSVVVGGGELVASEVGRAVDHADALFELLAWSRARSSSPRALCPTTSPGPPWLPPRAGRRAADGVAGDRSGRAVAGCAGAAGARVVAAQGHHRCRTLAGPGGRGPTAPSWPTWPTASSSASSTPCRLVKGLGRRRAGAGRGPLPLPAVEPAPLVEPAAADGEADVDDTDELVEGDESDADAEVGPEWWRGRGPMRILRARGCRTRRDPLDALTEAARRLAAMPVVEGEHTLEGEVAQSRRTHQPGPAAQVPLVRPVLSRR